MIVKIISKYTHVDSRVSRELIVKEGRYETERKYACMFSVNVFAFPLGLTKLFNSSGVGRNQIRRPKKMSISSFPPYFSFY